MRHLMGLVCRYRLGCFELGSRTEHDVRYDGEILQPIVGGSIPYRLMAPLTDAQICTSVRSRRIDRRCTGGASMAGDRVLISRRDILLAVTATASLAVLPSGQTFAEPAAKYHRLSVT